MRVLHTIVLLFVRFYDPPAAYLFTEYILHDCWDTTYRDQPSPTRVLDTIVHIIILLLLIVVVVLLFITISRYRSEEAGSWSREGRAQSFSRHGSSYARRRRSEYRIVSDTQQRKYYVTYDINEWKYRSSSGSRVIHMTAAAAAAIR